MGLLTRNSQRSLENTIKLFHGKIDLALSRDVQPSKPNVDPFLRFCEAWNIPQNSLLLAGDHLDDFIPALGSTPVPLLWVALSSRSCYVEPHYNTFDPTACHKPKLMDENGLSLANCMQAPSYIVEYRKSHKYYIPDIVVDNINELCQAWKNSVGSFFAVCLGVNQSSERCIGF